MNQVKLIYIALLLSGMLLPTQGSAKERSLQDESITQLEKRQESINAELSQLASFSLRSGAGGIGYRSEDRTTPDFTEWVRIDLEHETQLEQIVLVPSIWRHAVTGFHAEGFPVEFQLFAGTASDTNGTMIASFTEEDQLLPRSAPLIIDANGINASWIKLICTQLSQRSFDQLYSMELAEIFIFNSTENVALHQTATAFSSREGGPRGAAFLVDGFIPYLMNTSRGTRSLALISPIFNNVTATMDIDLGTSQSLDGVQLHAVEQSDTVPQSFVGALGIPRHMRIEGANHADFSDAVVLLETHYPTVYETGPILMHRLPGTPCRYVRFSALEPYTFTAKGRTTARFGFAELELFSKGTNVAFGKPVTANFELRNPARSFSTLTDGHNLYGEIIPIRDWMNELARRHELENELPWVTSELNMRYAKQHAKIKILSWITLFLLIIIGFIILIDRILRMRQAARIKERFAADLHDELGANLHAIGILGTHAKDVMDSPDKLARTVDEIKSLTDRTGEATRYCTDMQTAKTVHENLTADLRRTAQRIIANLDYTLAIEGEEFIHALKPRKRADLFLFFKESLININRHADATEVQIQLTADHTQLDLTISDNGCGLIGDIPSSLKRRARLLGGNISTKTSKAGGTCIALELRFRSRLRKRQK